MNASETHGAAIRRLLRAATILSFSNAHGLKLFISYSRYDLPFVRDLVHGLRHAGIEPWLDLANVSGGDRWDASIETALQQCSHCLVVVSPYSMRSVAVQRELEFALQQEKPVIPVLLQTTELPARLQSLQWVDFRINFERGLRSLLTRLRGAPLRAESGALRAPPRPIEFFGFVPILHIACPAAVKTVSGLIFLGGGLKFMLGYFLTHSSSVDEVFIAGMEIALGVVAMWWTLRAANRRSTLIEMAGFCGLAVLLPGLGLMADPKVLWPLLILPLDLTALIVILASRACRRWMTTYSVGWGRKVDRSL